MRKVNPTYKIEMEMRPRKQKGLEEQWIFQVDNCNPNNLRHGPVIPLREVLLQIDEERKWIIKQR